MEKVKTRWIFRITQYKIFEDYFLSEIVVFIFRCISLRVLDFCSPWDEIIVLMVIVVVHPFLSYCIKVSWCLLSFTWQFFFLHFDHCQSYSLSTLDFTWIWLTFLVPFIFDSKGKHLRCRSSTGSSHSPTRYELIHDKFVEICFDVLRVRILIIEF